MAKAKKPFIIITCLVALVIIAVVVLYVLPNFRKYPYSVVLQNNSAAPIIVKSLKITDVLDISGNIEVKPSAFNSMIFNDLVFSVSWEAPARERQLNLVIYETATGKEKSFVKILKVDEGRSGFYTLNYTQSQLLGPAFNFHCGY